MLSAEIKVHSNIIINSQNYYWTLDFHRYHSKLENIILSENSIVIFKRQTRKSIWNHQFHSKLENLILCENLVFTLTPDCVVNLREEFSPQTRIGTQVSSSVSSNYATQTNHCWPSDLCGWHSWKCTNA